MKSNDQVVRSIKELLRRPVAFYPALAILGGSVEAGLFLSQACYWSNTLPENRDGWFYKTQVDWQIETFLSIRQQKTARVALIDKGVIEEELRGAPAKLWFRVNFSAIQGFLGDWERSSIAESAILDSQEQSDLISGKRDTFNTESTAETTSAILPDPEIEETREASDRDLADLWREMRRAYKRLTGKSLGTGLRGSPGERFRDLVSNKGQEKVLAGFQAFLEHMGKESLRKFRSPIFLFMNQSEEWIDDASIQIEEPKPEQVAGPRGVGERYAHLVKH